MRVRLFIPSGSLAAALLLAACAGANLTPASSSEPGMESTGGALANISGTPVTAVQVGATYSFRPMITKSGRSVRFSIQNQPPWAQFNAKSGALTGTPSTSDIGTYSGIVISVHRESATTSLPAFSIAVTSTPTVTVAGGPLVLYTDLISGPNSGGENNKGAYLSIFGKNFGASGSGTTRDAIEAINYVINRKKAGVNVRVISASWGSTQKSRALEDVIRKAGEADILFVAASGNSSVDTDRQPHYPSSYKLDNVISVAALDRNDQLTSFSNYGLKSVHIAAPGKEILSTWLDNDFREASGTSMATPMVAGVAALVLSKNPDMTVEDLRKLLFKSVDTLPSLKGKVVTGGRINAAKAVGAE